MLEWHWTGTTPSQADFGDPASSTDYRLCVYDHAGLDPVVRRRRAVVAAVSVPARGTCGRAPCWHRRSSGFRYRDRSASRDGVTTLVLRQGKRGAPILKLDARGRRLGLRSLPLLRDVTTELDAIGGACWQADYSDFIKRNTATRFLGRAGIQSGGGG